MSANRCRSPACAAAALLAALLATSALASRVEGDADSTHLAGEACLQPTPGGTPIDPLVQVDPDAPEIATAYLPGRKAVYSRSFMAVAAHPVAAKVGCDVLARGGSATDAAVAVQMALTLVEPQSSGIGGGAFLLRWDAATGAVTAYDGRETAPAAATPDYLRWKSDADRTPPVPNVRASGRSIGTPGVLRMLEMAHADAGRLPWRELFEPAIRLATEGFRISPRLAASIAASRASLARDPDAAAYFLNADGSARAAGTLLRNPALAATLSAVADGGVEAFHEGDIARAIVAEIGDAALGTTPGATTLADLAAYRAMKREPVCTTYRVWTVCGMPPPSSGGIAVASALGILENFDLGLHAPTSFDVEGGRPGVFGVHLVAEAERLAYADRDRYIADADFVPLPGGSPAAMLDKEYLRRRAGLIGFGRSLGVAQPGDLGAPKPLGTAQTPESGTSHVSLVDRDGNVVVMTTTIEGAFGAFRMTRGFLLNNELTDFSAVPTDAAGHPIANAVAPGKRPRSSMAPTLVFRTRSDGTRGGFVMATGSPGGAAIIQHVVKTLVGTLDWGLDAQQAVSMVDFGAPNSAVTHVGGEHPNVNAAANGANDPLVKGLRALGHAVSVAARSSGLGSIVRTTVDGAPAYVGGADPRREGVVLGDTFVP